MYDFHYNFIRKKYKDNAVLLFTDTDSLCYLIRTRDIYQDISENRHLFDLSNYPQDHPLYNTTNKKKPGFFKDETGGCAIKEFVGLKSKMYSFTFMNEDSACEYIMLGFTFTFAIFNTMSSRWMVNSGLAALEIRQNSGFDL